MKRIDVAIGIVVRANRVLICQRKDQGPFGGLWEFPGGKCEAGEPPRQCVIRELREELGVEVEPGRALTVLEHEYPSVHVRLYPFLCDLTAGDPQPLESQKIEWTDPSGLERYPFPAANGPLLREVRAAVALTTFRPVS